jgi:predicted nucleotidyltransferase
MNLIDRNIDNVRALCLKHKVDKLFVFGFVLTDSFRKNSDVDLE